MRLQQQSVPIEDYAFLLKGTRKSNEKAMFIGKTVSGSLYRGDNVLLSDSTQTLELKRVTHFLLSRFRKYFDIRTLFGGTICTIQFIYNYSRFRRT